MSRLPLLLASLALCAGCASTPELPDGVSAAEALALAEAQTEAPDGDSAQAVDLLLAVRAAVGLSPELRTRAELALDRAVDRRIADLRADPDGVDLLLDLLEADLPRLLDARVAIAVAERQLEDGERLDCFETIRDLDQRDAAHPMRNDAARLLARAGFSLAEDPGSYLLGLASYRSLAPRVLEHLVIYYPAHPECPRAYEWLGRHYEEEREWDPAIQRYEELILYHPESSRAVVAALRVAELRMLRLARDDYDRGGLLRARDELLAWLARYPDHPEADRARERLSECRTRLASNDLIVADFYAEVERPFGARLHAERALVEAEASGNPDIVSAVREFLASLPEPEGPFPGAELAPLAEPPGT